MSFRLAFKILVQSAGSVGNKSKNVRGKIKLNFRPKLAATEKITANSSQVGKFCAVV